MKSQLHELTIKRLESLSASFKNGPLSYGLNDAALQQIAGNQSGQIKPFLTELQSNGFSALQIGILIDTILMVKKDQTQVEYLIELVLSGPEITGIPMSDTAATMHSIIESAKDELLLVGYAVHHAQELFKHIYDKMQKNDSLKVTFCLNINRNQGDTSLESEIVHRFISEFKEKHWPWEKTPSIYYDPRSLAMNNFQHTSLHAKCLVADRTLALVTSANFTEAAQERNIELGILIRHQDIIERIVSYFESLTENKRLVKSP